MDDHLMALQKVIVSEIQQKKQCYPARNNMKRLVQFLEVFREENGYSPDRFHWLLQEHLSVDDTLIEALLNGEIPDNVLDDDFLIEIAHTLNCEPHRLWAWLNRPLADDEVHGSPMPKIVGRRYELRQHLGSGSMGHVYCAFDRLSNQLIALKCLGELDQKVAVTSPISANTFTLALAREFSFLSSLRHPNIIQVLHYGIEADRYPYFTMELLESACPITEATGEDPVALLIQLFQALSYLHRCGLVHRDLKPGNVLVTNNIVKVLDFGLSISQKQPSHAAGTPKYMAPEIIQGAIATPASDLFSAGVIAYQLLYGRYPFAFNSPSELLSAILVQSPDFSHPTLDIRLISILKKLLMKHPKARFTDATEVIVALSEATDSCPPRIETIRESFLQAAPFVERQEEVKQILVTLEQARNGHGGLVLIAGESGSGKSRLCQEVASIAQVLGFVVLNGQAIRSQGQAYHLWHKIIENYVLTEELSQRETALLRAFSPEFSTLDTSPVPGRSDLPKYLGKALEEIIKRQHEPTMIVLEDLQWVDDESLMVLNRLSQASDSMPLLILGNYRNDDSPVFPQNIKKCQHIKLERLSPRGISMLAYAMMGTAGLNPAVIRRLELETEGNVFFLVETVRTLALEADGLEKVGQKPLPKTVFPRTIQIIINHRLNQVPGDYHKLLAVCAVIGRQINHDILQFLYPATNLDHYFNACSHINILENRHGYWRFSHDKLREGLLEELSNDQQRALHQDIALAIEHLYPKPHDHIIDLAYHWQAAGNEDKEFIYGVQAGDECMRLGSFLRAAGFFHRGLELTNDIEKRANLNCRLANAYREMFKNSEAQHYYELSLANYRSTGNQAQISFILRSLGNIYLAKSLFKQARELYLESYEIATQVEDTHEIAILLGCLGRATEYLDCDYPAAMNYYYQSLDLHRVLANRHGQGVSFNNLGNAYLAQGMFEEAHLKFAACHTIFNEINDLNLTMMAIFNLGIVQVWQGDYVPAEDKLKMCLRHYQENEMMLSIGGTLNQLGLIAINCGQIAEANQYFRTSLEFQEKAESQAGVAELITNLGTVVYIQENYSEALELIQQGVSLFRTMAIPAKLSFSLNQLGFVLIQMGDLPSAMCAFEEGLTISRKIGARHIALEALVGITEIGITNGDLSRSRKKLENILHDPSCFSRLKSRVNRLLNPM